MTECVALAANVASGDNRIMPSCEIKKGAIPRVSEELLPVLGIIRHTAK